MAKKDSESLIGRMILGFFSLVMGLVVMAVAADILPADESSIHAPRWVLSAAGLIFVLCGVLVFLSMGTQERGHTAGGKSLEIVQTLIGNGVITLFALILSWIAFGPGERQFSSTISLPFISISSADANELSGRICFGTFAVLLDGLTVWVWVHAIGRLVKTLGNLRDAQFQQ